MSQDKSINLATERSLMNSRVVSMERGKKIDYREFNSRIEKVE